MTEHLIRIISFAITITLQYITLAKLGDKGWKAAIPVYRHYTMGKIAGHPAAGLIWGIIAFASDFCIAFLVSDVVGTIYQNITVGSLAAMFVDRTEFLLGVGYLLLNALMTIARAVIFGSIGKRYMFPKLFILIWAVIPAIGYAVISKSKAGNLQEDN